MISKSFLFVFSVHMDRVIRMSYELMMQKQKKKRKKKKKTNENKIKSLNEPEETGITYHTNTSEKEQKKERKNKIKREKNQNKICSFFRLVLT